MKIKFLAIYLLAGAAFLGVSLWVFLSSGRSAKAIRAKYKLGGVMLTAWTMFSSAACEGVTPQVTCYEPVDPQIMCYDVPMETNSLTVSVKDYGGINIKPGDVLIVNLAGPTTDEYKFRIHAGDVEAPVIQEFSYSDENVPYEIVIEQTLSATDYKGEATIEAIGVFKGGDGNVENRIATAVFNIV